MNFKNYLVVDCEKDAFRADSSPVTLKLKMVHGFFRSDICSVLDVKDDWAPVGNDKLYFFPGCNVPRFKVRDKFVCTIKPEAATALFVNTEGMEGSDSTFTLYKSVMPVDPISFRNWLNHSYDNHLVPAFDSLSANAEVYLSKRLWDEYYHKRGLHQIGEVMDDYVHIRTGDSSAYYFKRMNASKEEYQLLGYNRKLDFSKLSANIYTEESLLKHLNADNLIIDEKKYEELRSFGLTAEKENEVLLIELMSNANFDESFVYLLFLLKEFGSNLKKLPESNHVNFRSLLSYLNITMTEVVNLNIHTMTSALRAKNKFTRANAMALSQLFATEYVNYGALNNAGWTKGPTLKKNVNYD